MKNIQIGALITGIALLTSCASSPPLTNQSAYTAPTSDQSAVIARLQARRASELGQPTVIDGNGQASNGAAGTAVLLIVAHDLPHDTFLVFDFDGYKGIQQSAGGPNLSPIRYLITSGEQHSISVDAQCDYRVESGSGHYGFDARGKVGWSGWVPEKDKKYTMTISISLTPPNITGESANGSASAKFYSHGPAGYIQEQIIQDDNEYVVAHATSTMHY